MIDELEKKIEKNNQSINELAIRIETLNRHADELFNELSVTGEQISTFIENKDHFTEENWNTLIEQRKALEEKLLRELANIRNPQKIKKTLSELRVQPHWLFVR